MDASQVLLTILGSVIGSGAVFGFIQFLIQRKDKKAEDEKNDKFDALREEFSIGLEEREKKGFERYTEHQKAIAKANEEHKEDFKKLLEAIKKLEVNDSKQLEIIEQMQVKDKYIGASLMALTHDKLIYLTNMYRDRGAITFGELANLTLLYSPYAEGLGGNGDGKIGYEYCKGLPKVSEEEAKRMDAERKDT